MKKITIFYHVKGTALNTTCQPRNPAQSLPRRHRVRMILSAYRRPNKNRLPNKIVPDIKLGPPRHQLGPHLQNPSPAQRQLLPQARVELGLRPHGPPAKRPVQPLLTRAHKRLVRRLQSLRAQPQHLHRRPTPRKCRKRPHSQRHNHLFHEKKQFRHPQLDQRRVLPEPEHQKARGPHMVRVMVYRPTGNHSPNHGPRSPGPTPGPSIQPQKPIGLDEPDDATPHVIERTIFLHSRARLVFSGILWAARDRIGIGTGPGPNHPLARAILVARLLPRPSAWSKIEKQTSKSCKRNVFRLSQLFSRPLHAVISIEADGIRFNMSNRRLGLIGSSERIDPTIASPRVSRPSFSSITRKASISVIDWSRIIPPPCINDIASTPERKE
ncbi:toll-Interleukin-Resistance domain family protein, partial [Striga asiatica]